MNADNYYSYNVSQHIVECYNQKTYVLWKLTKIIEIAVFVNKQGNNSDGKCTVGNVNKTNKCR